MCAAHSVGGVPGSRSLVLNYGEALCASAGAEANKQTRAHIVNFLSQQTACTRGSTGRPILRRTCGRLHLMETKMTGKIRVILNHSNFDLEYLIFVEAYNIDVIPTTWVFMFLRVHKPILFVQSCYPQQYSNCNLVVQYVNMMTVCIPNVLT